MVPLLVEVPLILLVQVEGKEEGIVKALHPLVPTIEITTNSCSKG
jgi:hypothetical protein